jgi:hypothetical protein
MSVGMWTLQADVVKREENPTEGARARERTGR